MLLALAATLLLLLFCPLTAEANAGRDKLGKYNQRSVHCCTAAAGLITLQHCEVDSLQLGSVPQSMHR